MIGGSSHLSTLILHIPMCIGTHFSFKTLFSTHFLLCQGVSIHHHPISGNFLSFQHDSKQFRLQNTHFTHFNAQWDPFQLKNTIYYHILLFPGLKNHFGLSSSVFSILEHYWWQLRLGNTHFTHSHTHWDQIQLKITFLDIFHCVKVCVANDNPFLVFLACLTMI